ncbi:MAG: hypothetical protein ABSH49_25700 [Bryobacteraceae bacterium]|jgi:hypothetical protein
MKFRRGLFWVPMALNAVLMRAQQPPVLFSQTFETGTGGWATGEGGRVRLAAGEGRQGAGALAFEYRIAARHNSGMVLPAPAELALAQSLRFRVKADHATALGILLAERKPGGGNYTAWFWAPANAWQEVELSPADFTVADGPRDPKDTDGKLDMDAVEAVGIFDLAQFFRNFASASPVDVVIDPTEGPRSIWLERFELSADPPAANTRRATGGWVSPGGMRLKYAAEANPLKTPALEAAYREIDGKVELLVRREAPVSSNPTRLEFDVASERDITLLVSLETKNPAGGAGPRYALPIFPPGNREPFHVSVKLEDFRGPGHFDAAQWRTTALVDVSTANGGEQANNTLWIANFRVE